MEGPFTKFAPFEARGDAKTVPPAAETRLPPPGNMPTGVGLDTERAPPDPLADIGSRLATLSDAVLQPEGLIARLFADLEGKARARHEETMSALTTIANGVVDLSERVGRLEPDVQRHEAALRLVALNGNGHSHGNGADR